MKYKLKWQVKLGLVLFLAAVVLFCTGMTKGRRNIEYSPYAVKPGDTVWSIAASCDGDIRENVWLIQQKNELRRNEYIHAGDLLYVPCE